MRLFALRGSDELGAAVAASMGAELDPLEEREFSDGEHKSRPLISVRNEDVYVLHTLHGTDTRSAADRLTRLLFFIAACRDNGAARVTAVVPYLAFMRKDQQTKPRDAVTSRYVAQLFDAVGTDMVVTLDVHNPAAFQNAFRRGSTHLQMRHLFVAKLHEIASSGRRLVFLSPDSGGMRRAHALREAYVAETGSTAGIAMMEKHRSEEVVTGELFAGDVDGAEVVIVDDMIASGGTVVRAAKASREHGASHVHAVATHALLSNDSAALFGPDLDTIVVSDSVSLPAVPRDSRLQVVSCASLLGGAIARLHAGGSIHRLLNPQP